MPVVAPALPARPVMVSRLKLEVRKAQIDLVVSQLKLASPTLHYLYQESLGDGTRFYTIIDLVRKLVLLAIDRLEVESLMIDEDLNG
jgi:hypothetical protein